MSRLDLNPFSFIFGGHILGSAFIQKMRDTFRVFYGLYDNENDNPLHYRGHPTYRWGLLDYVLLGLPVLLTFLCESNRQEDNEEHQGKGNHPLLILKFLMIAIKAIASVLCTLIVSPLIIAIHGVSSLIAYLKGDLKTLAYSVRTSSNPAYSVADCMTHQTTLYRLLTPVDEPIYLEKIEAPKPGEKQFTLNLYGHRDALSEPPTQAQQAAFDKLGLTLHCRSLQP